MLKNEQRTNNRIFAFDLLRVMAIFCVITIHSIGGFVSGPYAVHSMEFVLGNIFVSFARIGVPIFVMLSGALMLNEGKAFSIKKHFKRIVNLLLIFFVWSIFYAFFHEIILPIYKGTNISTENFLSACIQGHYHLWYLPMIIGLYLLTPILRLFVKRENSKYILYFIILGLIFQFLPFDLNYLIEKVFGINKFFNYLNKFQLSATKGYITYFLIGWYITVVPFKKNFRTLLYALGGISALFIVLGMQLLSTDTAKEYDFFYSETSLHVFLYSIAVFVFVYYLFNKKEPPKITPLIQKMSGLSFGVYLLHVLILEIPDMFLQTNNVYLQIPLNWILTTVITFALIWIATKIPIVKKIIK